MKIHLNGKLIETDAKNLGQLCSQLGFEDKKIATAMNGYFVPVSERPQTSINENDEIEILSPRQGG